MRLKLVLISALAVALLLPAVPVQSAPCGRDTAGCCCPDESSCPCAHDQDHAPPAPAECTVRSSLEQLVAELPLPVSIAVASPAVPATFVARPAPTPEELLLLLTIFRC